MHNDKTIPLVAAAYPISNRIVTHERLLLTEDRSRQKAISTMLGHEVAHKVFGDFALQGKKMELQADRFGLFMSNFPEEYAAFQEEMHKRIYAKEAQSLKNGNFKEKAQALLIRPVRFWAYGNLKDRLANIRKPLTQEEESYFQEAIFRFNAKMAQEYAGDKAKEAIVQEESHGSWRSRTASHPSADKDHTL